VGLGLGGRFGGCGDVGKRGAGEGGYCTATNILIFGYHMVLLKVVKVGKIFTKNHLITKNIIKMVLREVDCEDDS
jgi:hypothetical protein